MLEKTTQHPVDDQAVDMRRIQTMLGVRSSANNNRLGQFFTPKPLAEDIAHIALQFLPDDGAIRYLEPGFGHGAFFEAIMNSSASTGIRSALGYELDQDTVSQAVQLWPDDILDLRCADFTEVAPPTDPDAEVDLILCNPPYVRHHHLDTATKKKLQGRVWEAAQVHINGRAGLYCYFMLLAHQWLAPNAVAGWLLPSEFLEADYSHPVRDYLASAVKLLHIHRFESTESLFDDALVSSTAIFYRNCEPGAGHSPIYSCGKSLRNPNKTAAVNVTWFQNSERWILPNPESATSLATTNDRSKPRNLSGLFTIRRGIATGANRFFIVTENDVASLDLPEATLVPILPSSRYLTGNAIEADERGSPLSIPKLFLVDCNLGEDEIQRLYPSLWKYLEAGLQAKIHLRTLCRLRNPWYSHEQRPPAPLLCKYMGNNARQDRSPYSFILNSSNATATNAYYMLYPKRSLQAAIDRDGTVLTDVWQALNAAAKNELLAEGRQYGTGMVKLGMRKLQNLPLKSLDSISAINEILA